MYMPRKYERFCKFIKIWKCRSCRSGVTQSIYADSDSESDTRDDNQLRERVTISSLNTYHAYAYYNIKTKHFLSLFVSNLSGLDKRN